MRILPTPIEGLKLIEPKILRDERGFFQERYREDKLESLLGLSINFIQDNHSRSIPGVLRGLHFQTNPKQNKLIGVIRGRIWDVAVDIRKGSPTFGKSFGIELNESNALQLFIPYGFAHGFCVLGEKEADVLYKVDGYYNPQTDLGFRWNDPALKIEWPVSNPKVSEKDAKLPMLSEIAALVV